MNKKIAVTILCICLTLNAFAQQSDDESDLCRNKLSSVRRSVGYTINDSVDNYGNLYISYHSFLPSVLTFVNSDGSVTVCASNKSTNTTHVYEYSRNLQEQKTLSFQNELGSLGAFTKDNDGSYYFFYSARSDNQDTENMAMVKYDRDGKKIKTYRLKAYAPDSFDGIRIPFYAGTCRLELSGSMLTVYFAREMFGGQQASYGFVLDKDTFERIDRGQVRNDKILLSGNNIFPYISHSFNQFILPISGGFLFADHGDGYPRSFTFSKFIRGSETKHAHAFTFPGSTGANVTHAEMGGLAKTSSGYIFAGVFGGNELNSRNLFVLTFDENLTWCSALIYLTKYTKDNGHAGHPKIVSIGNGQYVLLWEFFSYSIQGANLPAISQTGYLSTFALVINENGEAVSGIQDLNEIRLNMNDTLRYNSHNGKVYWAINDSSTSFTLYALEVQ